MFKYPISTLLYLAKQSIKDKIQDALKLHNNIDVKLTAIVKDKDGKIIKQHKQRSHSFLMNFLANLAEIMVNSYNDIVNYYVYRSTEGTWWTIAPAAANAGEIFAVFDSANDSTYGIVVGTGTSPPTPMDYQLENQIQNGTGSGQLVYGSHLTSPTPASSGVAGATSEPAVGVLTPSGNTTSFQMSRTFQNLSGASITVSEVGVIVKQLGNAQNVIYVLIIHDLLSSPITVPPNAVLTIVYTISVTT